MRNKQLILETAKNLTGLKARNVKLGIGSFITMGFGNDIKYPIKIRGQEKIKSRPEWYLWIQDGDWELHLDESGQNVVCTARDDREKIAKGITLLDGLPLLEIKAWPSLSATKFIFGTHGPSLLVHALERLRSNDNQDWMLFTPDQKVLCVRYMNAWMEAENNEKTNEKRN